MPEKPGGGPENEGRSPAAFSPNDLKMPMRLPILFTAALACFYLRIRQYGLSLDPDEWGILNAGREILRGNFFAGDANKTLELLLALIPVYFDQPLLFPLLTSLFGAGACLAVYLLAHRLTGDPLAALLAWGMLLLSPVLYWQVIVCNSVAIMTALVLIAIYCFSQGKIRAGCVWMALAELSRPEPFFLLPALVLYLGWRFLKDQAGRGEMVRGLAFLLFPLFLWLALSAIKSGSAFASYSRAVDYGKALASDQGLWVFPRVFWGILGDFYMGPVAALFALAGVLALIPAARRYAFLYGYLLFTLAGYWGLVTFGTALQERFLLPVHAALLIFSAALFAALRKNIGLVLKKGPLLNAAGPLLACGLLLMNTNLNGHRTVDHILNFHNRHDADLPRAAALFREAIAANPGQPPVMLISARRMGRMDYLLDDVRGRYTLVSFRHLYFQNQDLGGKSIGWVLYAPDDIYPMKSAFYNMELLTEEGLKKQELRVDRSWVLSESTRLLKLARD